MDQNTKLYTLNIYSLYLSIIAREIYRPGTKHFLWHHMVKSQKLEQAGK